MDVKKLNYYDMFGLDHNAGEADIKSAFRRLALRYHPDKNPDSHNAQNEFIVIKNAYDVLMHQASRKRYDAYLKKAGNSYSGPLPNIRRNSPLIEKILEEFNFLLWDMEDMVKKIDEKNIKATIGNTELYDFLLSVFRNMENRVLHEDDRYAAFRRKKGKTALNISNYFFLLRVEIEKRIRSLPAHFKDDSVEIQSLLPAGKEMRTSIGKVYEAWAGE